MTRKDYLIVAARIKRGLQDADNGAYAGAERAALGHLAYGLADDFAADRPEFDRARFLRSCGLGD